MSFRKSIGTIAAALAFLGLSALPLAKSAQAQESVRLSLYPLSSTLNSFIGVPLQGAQGVTGFQVTGLTTAGATLTIEASTDGRPYENTNKIWFAINGYNFPGGSTTGFTTVAADGQFRVDNAGADAIRVRVSSGGTGTIQVSYNTLPGVTLPGSSSGGGGGGGAITAAAGSYSAGAFVVGTALDGWNATEGAKADAAWVSGSGSMVAVLKAVDRDVLLPIPAGTNAIGTVSLSGPFGTGTADAASLAITTGGAIGSGGANLGTGANGWFATLVTDLTTLNNSVVAGQCTQPCPVKQLGDQSTYEAIGGTGNAALTNTAGALQILTQSNNLLRIECWNPNTTPMFLQLFDSATSITLGTTVPTKSVECPAGNGTQDGIYDHEYNGVKFTAGLRVAATTTRTGSTAPGSAVAASIGYALGN